MKISSIINEEIKKVLNEAYVVTDDRFNFKQQLTNSLFYNYESFNSEFDSDVTESNIIVTWKVSFWLNQMGIENFIVDVEKLEGTFKLELRDKHSDELQQETDKNINEFEWKFIIDEDAALIKGKSFYISDLTFDFKNKICTIGF
jgi:hypothetical protein